VRLQKVLSQAGVASRRVAERMIIDGRVEVDGQLVTELGTRVGPGASVIRVDGARVTVDDTPWVPRAHGHETTYQTNLTEADEIASAVHELAEQVVADIRAERRACMRVHLKVRFAPFFTVTRVRKLPEPTYDADVIARTALALLARLDDDRPIRLLGVRAEMVPPDGGYD